MVVGSLPARPNQSSQGLSAWIGSRQSGVYFTNAGVYFRTLVASIPPWLPVIPIFWVVDEQLTIGVSFAELLFFTQRVRGRLRRWLAVISVALVGE